MSKIKLLTVAVIGLLVINVAILAFLFSRKPMHPPRGEGQMRPQGPKNIIIERLDFDKEQVEAYEILIKNHQKTIDSLSEEIRTAKNNLYKSLTVQNFAGKDSLINVLGALQQKVEHTHYNHFIDLKKLCRPNQFDNYNQLTKELAKFFSGGKPSLNKENN